MTKQTLYGTVEQISRHTAVIVTDTEEDLYQCARSATHPFMQSGDIVKFTLTPNDEIDAIVIDYSEIQRRYAQELH